MKKKMSLMLLLSAILLLVAGCAPFTAEPSSFTFEGVSWKVSSAKLTNELEWPPIKPQSSTDVLLIIQFDPSQPIASARSEALRTAFSNTILKGTGLRPDQYFPSRKGEGGPITSMICVFSVPKETDHVSLVLSDAQIIKITLRR